jgi:hypothetical protein
MANIRYKMETTYGVDAPGDICSVLTETPSVGMPEELARWAVRTRDEQVRQALIEKGWTPPANG